MFNISKNKILVVGDLMLDSYWHGVVSRISPEAPVPVFRTRSRRSVAGGAANVAANLLAAGQEAIVVSCIGKDSVGDELKSLLETLGCDCTMIFQSDGRHTTEKTRLLAQNNQQLLRVDEEDIRWLTEEEEKCLLDAISSRISDIKAMILSDYMKGILTESFCQRLIQICRERRIPIYCDVKDPNILKYKGATLLKPNRKELEVLTGVSVKTDKDILEACRLLCDKADNAFVLVTLGSDGMALYTKKTDDIHYIESEPREVFDVSGAGDTVISYLVSCLSSGLEIMESVKFANKAAGIKVGKVGTATVSIEEMKQKIRREEILEQTQSESEAKIKTLSELLQTLHNKANKKIVFTNGCFDILHAGHVMYLNKAAELGDYLIVGVNSDESVKRLKGSTRPVNDEGDRLSVLAGLQSVSYLILFDEDTPENLIKSIKPDVLVKGADYEGKYIAGADYVKENGGEVRLIPMLEGHSTTRIIEKSGGTKGHE